MDKKSLSEILKEKGIENALFKTEGLGALEFDLQMLGKNFKKEAIPFRIERVSTDSFMKLIEIENEVALAEAALKTFVAFPSEARDKEYFNLDMDAMLTLVTVITEFQQTPLVYIEGIKK